MFGHMTQGLAHSQCSSKGPLVSLSVGYVHLTISTLSAALRRKAARKEKHFSPVKK